MKRLVPILLLSLFALPTYSNGIRYSLTVAQDGSGDYTTIQEAINNTKAFPDKRITITVKNGIYREKVKIHEWNTLISLIGESEEKTIITFDDHFKKVNLGRNSTFHTSTMLVEGNDFHAENITIENAAGPVGQAVALTVNADRVSFDNTRFIGNQDTLYLTGEGKRQYFKNCYIEGTTDFIFGQATAVFENCVVHSKANSYITAASTANTSKYGLVFIDCQLTAAKGVTKVYLGRPWRPYAKTVFINTLMGGHIIPQGWHNWSKPEAEKTVFYAEYGSTGAGNRSGSRASWSKTLAKKQATQYTTKNILGPENWYFTRH